MAAESLLHVASVNLFPPFQIKMLRFIRCRDCVGKTKPFGAKNTVFLLRAQLLAQTTFSRKQWGTLFVLPAVCFSRWQMSRSQPRAFSPLLTSITTPFEYVSRFAQGQSLWKFPSCIWFMLFQPFSLSRSHVAMNIRLCSTLEIFVFFFP